MSIKIIHTADNHIGMSFGTYPANVKEQLLLERISALKNIVSIANKGEANFLVVAGDLFDGVKAKLADIKEVATILKAFIGDAVIVLPGNHDFYESTPDSLWQKFKKHTDSLKIIVLENYEPYEHSIGEQKIVFYPASCRSKHSQDNMIAWVKEATKEKDSINIGIAHGNVTGLGLDTEENYFNMSPEELNAAGVDFWLLGHIHVPFPKTSVSINPGYFMPATHTPDGLNCRHHGFCWSIEVDENKMVKGELIQTGKIGFYDWKKIIASVLDFEKLKTEINALDKKNSIIRIDLEGRLNVEEIKQLKKEVELLKADFLHFVDYNNIKINIDAKYIDANYTKDSLPHKLLSSLIKEDDGGLELQLANELIEKLKS